MAMIVWGEPVRCIFYVTAGRKSVGAEGQESAQVLRLGVTHGAAADSFGGFPG
jgi:hypothetical protein